MNTTHVIRPWRFAILGLVLMAPPLGAAEKEVSFIRDVAPVLTQRCTGCHGAQKAKGEYRLHTFNDLLSGGESGEEPVTAGKPDESELYRRLVTTKAGKRMPPGDDGLSEAEVAAVRRWIAAGAMFDGRDRAVALKSILPPRNHPDAPKTYRVPVPVFALAFSPDGKELAVGGYHEVTVWEPSTGRLLRRVGRLPQRIHALVYNRDGSRLLVGGGTPGEYGELTLVDPVKGGIVRTYGVFDDVVLGVAFSRDDSRVAAGSADRWARAYRADDGRMLWQAQLHSDWVTAVSFTADGRFLATASKDRTVKVLEADSGALFTTYNGHRKQYGEYSGRFDVYDVAFTADGRLAFSAGEGPVIRVWDPLKAKEENGTARDMEERFAKGGHTQYLVHNAARPVFKLSVRDGRVFSAAGDGLIREHDAVTGKLIREYKGHSDWAYAVDFHAANHRLASGSFDGEVRVWDTATGACVRAFKASPGHETGSR